MSRKTKLSLAISATFILGLAIALAGCESTTTMGTEAVEGCTLDVNNLEGMFIAKKATPEKGDFEDKDFRILFTEKGGKKVAVSTGGRVYPQLPLTEKFDYEFVEVSEKPDGQQEAFYKANLVRGFNAEELEAHKKKNKNLGWKVEGMLYIRVDEKRCQLKVSDMYATFMEGKRVEDFNVGGQGKYVKAEEQNYGMVSCPPAIHRDKPEENRQGELVAWSKENPDPNKDESFPRDRAGTIVPVGKPVYWSFIETERNAKSEKDKNCTYSFDVYLNDLPVDGKANQSVEVGEKWTYWQFDMTHTELTDSTFIEIHRSQTCDGKKEIIDSVCNIVKTEAPADAAPAEG